MTQKMMFGLMVILLFFILILPVTADPLVTVTTVCPATVCVDEEFTCTFTTTYISGPELPLGVGISDYYPFSMKDIKNSVGGIHYGAPISRVDWNYGKVLVGFSATETITMTASSNTGPGQYSRIIGYFFTDPLNPTITEEYSVPITVNYCNGGTPAPEFPSAFLPITMIIGFLGAVLLIQRTREH
jgi:hypothetical protein